jgi:hypothetical protein
MPHFWVPRCVGWRVDFSWRQFHDVAVLFLHLPQRFYVPPRELRTSDPAIEGAECLE